MASFKYRLMCRVAMIGLVASSWSGIVVAQCVYGGAPYAMPILWPSEIGFTPAHPAPGDVVTLDLGPVCICRISGPVTVTGQEVTVGGLFITSAPGVPPPPSVYHQLLGSLPAGSYRVHLQLTSEASGLVCPEIVTPLLVGPVPPPEPLPATGRWPIALLIAGLATVAFTDRRRSLRRH